MRVLLLSERTSVHTYRWAVSLAAEGLDVGVFSLEAGGDYDYASHGVREFVVGLSLVGKRTWRSRLSYCRVLGRLYRVFRAFRPDIVHAHYATHHGLLGALSGFRPYYLSVWGSDVYSFPRRSMVGRLALRFCFWRATRLLSTSHAMAAEARRYTSKEFAVVPFGVDTSRFKPSPDRDGAGLLLFGCVKSLEYRYGIDLLLLAFADVVRANPDRLVRLEIVGSGGEYEALSELVVRLGIGDRVVFRGFVPQSELPGCYGRYLACVFPSREESFGVVALESMACGCPVIASDADGFRETVQDGVTGILTPRGDVASLVTAMNRMLRDSAARRAMAAAGRSWVCERYEWRENVRSVVAMYHSEVK